MQFFKNATAFVKLGEEKEAFIQLAEELWEYIKLNYFTIDHGVYLNLGIDPNAGRFRIETFIIFGMLGLMLACFMGSFNKGVLGQFVRDLESEECFSVEKAKTLSELGYLKNTAVRASLKRGYTLRSVVRCVEEDNGTLICSDNKNGTVAFNDAHFYIPEEFKYKAAIKFEGKKTPVIFFILLPILTLAVIIFLIKVFPNILMMLDDFIGMIKPDSNILT